MNDWHESTRADYASKGLGSRSGYGVKPALLIVDFSNGFTDPASPLGGDFDQQVAVTARLLTGFRDGQLPVVFTTVAYEPDFRDAVLFKDHIWLKLTTELPPLRVSPLSSRNMPVRFLARI
jgi:nicotinamidase-related amidase